MPPPSTNISKRRLAYKNLVEDAHSKWCTGTGSVQDSSQLDIQLLHLGYNESQVADLRKPPHPFVSCQDDIEVFNLTRLWGADADADMKRKRSSSKEDNDDVTMPPPAPKVRQQFSSFPMRDFEAVPRRAEESLRRDRRPMSGLDVLHPNCVRRSIPASAVAKQKATTRPKGDAAHDVRARQISGNVRFWSGDREVPAVMSQFVAKVKGVKKGDRGFPARRALRILSNEHIEQSYGTLRSTSSLLEFFGDTRLFSEEMWRYLYLPGAPGRK